MTRIKDLLLHSGTVERLALLRRSISELAAHSRTLGSSKTADSFDADILYIDARIKRLKELGSE
jgi:hypothetical protein